MADHVFDPNGDITLIMNSRPEHDRTLEGGGTPAESGAESTLVQENVGLDVRMLVSSRHLILASSVFKAMLQDRFKVRHFDLVFLYLLYITSRSKGRVIYLGIK